MPSVSRQVARFQGRIEGVARSLQQQLTDYQKDKRAADKLLTIGAFKANRNSTHAELAAWTMVANTILNLDETIRRKLTYESHSRKSTARQSPPFLRAYGHRHRRSRAGLDAESQPARGTRRRPSATAIFRPPALPAKAKRVIYLFMPAVRRRSICSITSPTLDKLHTPSCPTPSAWGSASPA